MNLKISLSSNWQKEPTKKIQWVVFAILLITLAWCFWVYYDTTNQIEKTGTSNAAPPATLNESKLNQILATMEQRQERYITPPVISYDPFQ